MQACLAHSNEDVQCSYIESIPTADSCDSTDCMVYNLNAQMLDPRMAPILTHTASSRPDRVNLASSAIGQRGHFYMGWLMAYRMFI